MKFVSGIIIAMAFLVAVNIILISQDIEAGNVLDFTKSVATLNMDHQSIMADTDKPTKDLMVMPTSVDVMIAMGSGIPTCSETRDCFLPADISIGIGDTVNWINDDAYHTVTAGDLTDTSSIGFDYPDGFDSSLFTVGDTFSHTFEEPGVYPYFCTLHPWMLGTITVQ